MTTRFSAPNEASVGGRKVIVDHMVNHYQLLARVHATMDTRKSSTASRRRSTALVLARRRREQAVMADHEKGVRNMQRRMDECRLGVDCSPPTTFNVGENIYVARKSRERAQAEKHNTQIRNMERRIASYRSTMDDRSPSTYGLGEKIHEARVRRERKAAEAHLRNVHNMERRIYDYQKKQDPLGIGRLPPKPKSAIALAGGKNPWENAMEKAEVRLRLGRSAPGKTTPPSL